MTSGTLTRRERQRAATVEEIKEVARGLMREHGASEVRFTDIAKVMGMTPPALYRYYDDRDALLTDLIADGYRDLGRAVAEARELVDPDDVAGRWIAVGRAYRDWACREPAQFALILQIRCRGTSPRRTARPRMPPRMRCPSSRSSSSGRRSSASCPSPWSRRCPRTLRAHFDEKDDVVGWEIQPATHQAMLQAWATLHGITCLDVYGQFDRMDEGARDALFESTLRCAALAAGFPVT